MNIYMVIKDEWQEPLRVLAAYSSLELAGKYVDASSIKRLYILEIVLDQDPLE
jgi:hypothetical protein